MKTYHSNTEQRAWYCYDWANSGFSTTVITVFLGPYLTALAKAAADAQGHVHPLGLSLDARSYWTYLISLSVILQVLVLPVAGAIADYGGRKRELLGLATYVGSAAGVAMFFVTTGDYILGGVLFLVANVSFGVALTLYNAFLPEIAPPGQQDAVSSRGYAIGYLGGGVLLALNLAMYLGADNLGISEAFAVRVSLGSAGLWWALFAIPTLWVLHNRGPSKSPPPGTSAIRAALGQLSETLRHVRQYPQTMRFLIAYLLYNDAIQTVLAVSSQFGNDELKMPVGQLTLAILMVQFVAFFGAVLFNWVASATSAQRAVLLSLAIWSGVLLYMYFFVTDARGFFIAAAVVALVMGGSQALSRSLFSLLIPKGHEAEYFSIYEISEKGTSWLCPLIFGLAVQFLHSYRVAILSLIVFFIAGMILLWRVDMEKGQISVHQR